MLATKIRVLSSRGAVVTRSRLIERLNTNPNRRLTLVSAPAGFGKTALVSVWLQGLKREQLDSRLERFLTARDRKGNLRIATKEEFKAEFERVLSSGTQSDRRALGVLINPLLGFSRDTRPVFWRVLSVQYYLYSRVVGRDGEDGPFEEDVRLLGERFAEDKLAEYPR